MYRIVRYDRTRNSMYRIVLYDRSVVCAEGIYTCTCLQLLEMLLLANSSGGNALHSCNRYIVRVLGIMDPCIVIFAPTACFTNLHHQ